MRTCGRCKRTNLDIEMLHKKSKCKECAKQEYKEKNGHSCGNCGTKCLKRSKYCSVRCALLGNVDKKENGCWEWKGGRTGDGYGAIVERKTRKQFSTHRKSYEEFKGEVIKGYCVCHSCDNPLCCNPEHLFLGTPGDNTRDSVKKGRARCLRQNGSKNPMAKLNEDLVKEIKRLFSDGWMTRDVESLLNIHHKRLEDIKYNKRWRHVLLE
jgi:hypothetical protein